VVAGFVKDARGRAPRCTEIRLLLAARWGKPADVLLEDEECSEKKREMHSSD